MLFTVKVIYFELIAVDVYTINLTQSSGTTVPAAWLVSICGMGGCTQCGAGTRQPVLQQVQSHSGVTVGHAGRYISDNRAHAHSTCDLHTAHCYARYALYNTQTWTTVYVHA